MQLRDYQSAAVAAVWRSLCEQPGNPLLVMPTGSGKSPVIGSLCQTAIEKYGGRVIVLAHRRELLEQNAEKIRAFLPALIPTGIYSAGLKRYSTEDAVICAGIQSVHGKAELFGSRQLAIIDECHLVPDGGEGMYQTFISDLREINPRLRVAGLTATPYRTSTGSLVGPEKIFQRVCHETSVRQLIDANWLSPLVTKPANSAVDTSKLHVSRGEFDARESEKLFDATDKVRAACEEIAIATAGRRSVLVFCQGVEHATHVAEILEHVLHEQVGLVVGSTSPLERSTTLRRFKSGEIRVVVNCDVLTTGFDAPNIDAICVLRATLSPGLFAQMVGRGLRLAPEKKDCLVLDFGRNVERHSKLDDPEYGRKKKQKREGQFSGEAVTKVCPNCEAELHGSATECECGWLFPRELKHERKAADEELLGHISEPEWFAVTAINYTRHTKKNNPERKPDTLRVDYECERETGENMGEVISEWICIEHTGFARKGAVKWWKRRSELPTPATIADALGIANNADEWFEPTRIKAHKEGRFWKIDEVELALREVAFEFGGEAEDF